MGKIGAWRVLEPPKLGFGHPGWRFGGPRDRQDGHLGALGGGLGANLGSFGGVLGSISEDFGIPNPPWSTNFNVFLQVFGGSEALEIDEN